MAPAWSYSRLDAFKTCPRKFHQEMVVKAIKQVEGEAQLYGTRVHKWFEDYVARDIELPEEVIRHKTFLDKLKSEGKLIGVERKVAINVKLQPVEFFAPDVWWRGILDTHFDLGLFNGRRRCRIVDYKTGKPHAKMRQLHEFAVYGFCEGFDEAEVMYYWTQNKTSQPIIMPVQQMNAILREHMSDLAQYKEAFNSDTWQPRKSGLCKAWCDVSWCEHFGGGRR